MGNDPADHFSACAKMVDIGKGARRKVDDCELNRYACSLVAQKRDPHKPEIAAAQGYFAIMTHVAEVHGLGHRALGQKVPEEHVDGLPGTAWPSRQCAGPPCSG